MDDTTTIRIFDKLDTISVDVGVIKATMVDLPTMTEAVSSAVGGCRANPPRTSRAPKANGKTSAKLIGAVVAAIGALTTTVLVLVQLL